MSGKKIRIDSELYGKLKKHSVISGYSSVEEFIVHILEKELARSEAVDSEEAVRKRLKGLGYLS